MPVEEKKTNEEVKLSEERKAEIKDAMLKVMIDEIVNRHILPTSKGTLTMEINRISNSSHIPIEELTAFLKDRLPPVAIKILVKEAMEAIGF